MSKRNLDPNQFKLFMTGTEWQAHVTHSTDGPVPDIWEQKEAQARVPFGGDHGSGVYDSIKEHGWQNRTNYNQYHPTIILEDSSRGVRRVQSEGHHRIAAAAAVERETGKPEFIPTRYVDNTAAGRRARKGYKL